MRAAIIFSTLLWLSCSEKPADRFTYTFGKKQHILETGKGQPVVLFISGFGDRVSSWMSVQKQIAGVTRTFSYDRAGLGESEMISKDRSLDSMLFELNELLRVEKIAPPYILVGHSYGGHIARYFAHKHPDKVVGLVLIDATVEHMHDEFKRIKTVEEIRKYDSLMEHGRDPNWKEGVRNESDYFSVNNEKMKGLPFNPAIPTTVITAMKTPESSFDFLKGANEIKVALHKRWASEYPHIRHVYANKSGHYVQFDEPELVISEVLNLVGRNK
ncbi:MAG TPA: alpha/beta hydrolase [Chryseosolibacter sp.]